MHISEGLRLFWRDTDHAQIGIDDRVGARLDSLLPGEIRLIDALTMPHTHTDFYVRAHKLDVPRSRAQRLESVLRQAGFLIQDDTPCSTDSCVYRRWHMNIQPQRSACHVHIVNLDYLGIDIALALAHAGIGRITTADAGTVDTLTHRQLPLSQPGEPKINAVARTVHMINPHTNMQAGEKPDYAILTNSYAADPFASQHLISHDVPVLHAWVEEVDTIIGPFTFPHKTACAACLYLYRIDADPAWALLGPQALHSRPLAAHTANRQLAACIAVRALLNEIDGFPSSLRNHMCVIPPPPNSPILKEISPHPQCGCCIDQEPPPQSPPSHSHRMATTAGSSHALSISNFSEHQPHSRAA